MSVKSNIVLNTISQIYMALLSIITLPFYIDVLGSTAYGLVAFFLQMQTLISLLDIGISATVSRNTALYRAGTLARPTYLASLRSIEFSFALVAVALLFGSLSAAVVVKSWLNIGEFSVETATKGMELIFVVIAVRWMQTYYRAILLGAEALVWLGWFNIAMSTVRIVGVLPYLYLTDGDIIDFFWYQIVVNTLELVIFFGRTNQLIGFGAGERFGAINRSALIQAIKSSWVIGLTTLVWALITQADKFLASGMLLLTDYTAYSLMISISSVLLLLSGTFIYAIGPTMARLLAQGNKDQAISIFRQTSLAVSLALGAACAVVVGWSEPLLFAWTGNVELAKKAAEYLPMYMLAGLFFALGNLSYAIHYALGDFSVRLRYSVLSLVLYVPLLFVFANWFGEAGLVYSWLFINAIFWLLPQFMFYRQLSAELYRASIWGDICRPVMLTMLIVPVSFWFPLTEFGRASIFGWLLIIGVLALSIGMLFSRARPLCFEYYRNLRKPGL